MRHAVWTTAALLALATTPLAAQQRGGIFRGQVTDSLGVPVPLAEIAILGTGLRIVADSEGVFRISDVPVGLHPVIVRSIGWKPLFLFLQMGENEERIARIGLEPAPQQLPELIVEGGRFAKPPEYAFTKKYDGFFHRRRIRSGTFVTRADFTFANAIHTGDLLRGIPGVRVSFGPGGTGVLFTSCRGYGGKVAVWIDGARIMADANTAMGYVRPSDIEMIEVYRRIGQIPGEFMDGDSCAAIVIWTR